MSGTEIRLAVQSSRRLVRDTLSAYLDRLPEFVVVGQTGGIDALRELCALRRPDATLVDAGELTVSTVNALARVRETAPRTEIVVAYSEVAPRAIEAALAAGITALVPCSRGLDTVLRTVRERVRPAASRPPDGLSLTEREMEIMSLMGSGHSVPEMAELLRISPRTVENHKRRLYGKLGVGSSSQAVSRATSFGLVDAVGSDCRGRSEDPGRPPLVVVHGTAGPTLDRALLTLYASGLPVVHARVPAALSQDHWALWQLGPVVVVLVDPVPESWFVPASLAAPTMVVHTGEPDLPTVIDALMRGAQAVVRGADVSTNLVAALSLVVRGYFAMAATRLDDLAEWIALRLGDGVSGVPELTTRECDILGSIASGHTVRQTARALGIAAKTVENTQARLFRKLGARNRTEALTIAYRLGLVDTANAVAATPLAQAPGS